MLVRLGLDDLKVVLRDSGELLKWSSILYILPILAGIWFRENPDFIIIYGLTGLFSFFLGMALKKLFRTDQDTDLKHAFMIVGLVWIVFTVISAVPFSLIMGMQFLDSFFEAMSAITTTGLSMMVTIIDSAPKSLILWRSLLSWIGGVGIVVLSLMGIFTTYTKSAKLMVAEGREELIRPNLKNTAKEIWIVYVFLTILSLGLLFFVGMDFFSAVNYSMSAISTTGMDITSTGLVGIDNPLISLSLVLIMLVGATSFSAHYLFIRKKEFGAYFKDNEFKIMISILIISVIVILPKMMIFYPDTITAVETALFHNSSALTCGGFFNVPLGDIAKWDDFILVVLMGLMVIGGSSGSTAGGIKISRIIIFAKSIYWRIKELILPKDSYFQKKFEGKPIENRLIREVNQFILLYLLIIFVGVFVLTMQGTGFTDALFVVISAQGNVGLDVGVVNTLLPLASKIMLILSMWIGRLEIIPLLSAIGFALSFRKS
ncbi:MAG: TrkH family potassium uptake protein [Candidatus Diapherotrites archaeon]